MDYRLEYLVSSADESAMWRGHAMIWTEIRADKGIANGHCVVCGAQVQCLLNPAPNQIDIAGSAVAINCTQQDNDESHSAVVFTFSYARNYDRRYNRMKLYKLTDQNGNTQNNTNWIPKTTHEKQSCSNPELCSANVYHAYTNANLALLLNPIHADISNPRMFECSGDIVVSDWGKVGCFKMTSKKELQMPAWYTNQKTRKQVQVMFAVLCAESVLRVYETYSDDLRPRQAIEAAKEYLKYQTTGAADAAARAAYAAYAAAGAADAADAAARAAARAAYAADAAADAAARAANTDVNFAKLADIAVKDITK